MPCMSYETNWANDNNRVRRTPEIIALKDECDRLARIACRAISLLEQIDPELKSFKDTESRKWWSLHKKADKARIDKETKEASKKESDDKLRKEALAKLTPEEIAVFGLIKKGKK